MKVAGLRAVEAALGAALVATLASCVGRSPAERSASPGLSAAAIRLTSSDTLRLRAIAPGVTHVYAWDGRGPWAIQLLEIDTRMCRPVVRARKAGPPQSARARTSELGGGDVAAINADFFQLPGGTPVGAHVSGGRVITGPGVRPVFAVADGGYWMGEAVLRGFIATAGDTVSIGQVNRPLEGGAHQPAGDGVVLYTAWYGDSVDTPALAVRVIEGDARAGRGVVVEDAGLIEPGARRVALRGRGTGEEWILRRAPRDTLTWSVAVVSAGGGRRALEAVGGFPLLVRAGRDVVAEQEGVSAGFGPTRHPRTAVGWTDDGARLYWAVIDGRQSPYSDGMTLGELAELFLRIGADNAINLDGGGSSAMVVRGVVVNRPSDAQGERAVGNVLALESCG